MEFVCWLEILRPRPWAVLCGFYSISVSFPTLKFIPNIR
jgi:hypothetical protein